VDRGLILDKNRGLFAKWWDFWISDLFSNGKGVDSVHGSWTTGGAGPWWIVNRASAVAR
jgi:hypothetical protein